MKEEKKIEINESWIRRLISLGAEHSKGDVSDSYLHGYIDSASSFLDKSPTKGN